MKINGHDLDGIYLDDGPHPWRNNERCVMEWVSLLSGDEKDWLARQEVIAASGVKPVSEQYKQDHPPCVDRVITSVAIRLNDALPDDSRQKLKAFIPRIMQAIPGLEDAMVHDKAMNLGLLGGSVDLTPEETLTAFDELLDWHSKQLADAGLLHKIPTIQIED